MALTDTFTKNTKHSGKPAGDKHSDGGGMYLLVNAGGKYWRMDYRFADKRKTLALGVYPEVSLAKARQRREKARELLADGIDPSTAKREEKRAKADAAAHTFELVARDWLAKTAAERASTTQNKVTSWLEKDVIPFIGAMPMSAIGPRDVLAALRKMEARGALDSVHRVKQVTGQVFRYAVATGRAERDPTGDLRGALPPARKKHRPAITTPPEVGALLRSIEVFKGTLIVHSALMLSPLVFVRPGELRKAEWAEIDLEKGEWNIPAERMKGWVRKGITTPHLVPLAPQAVAILRNLHPLTGRGVYVFAGRDPKQPMSNAAVNAGLRRMGYDTKTEMTGHGFRAMARTILHEELGIDRDAIEHQLAHAVPDALGTAYNRTKFIKDRRRMMDLWADYLGRLKAGAPALSLPQAEEGATR